MQFRMVSFLRRHLRNTTPEWLLLACWIAGSSLGLMAARFCGDEVSSFLSLLPGRVPDWGGIVTTALLPLLFSAIAVICFRSAGCFLCCLLRGLAQGMMIGLIAARFGDGSPVMTALLLFSSWASNPVLLLFWLRCLKHGGRLCPAELVLPAGCCLLIGAVDRLLIAPFLVDVMILST